MRELRSVLPYARPYRRAFLVGLLFVLTGNLFTLAGPYLMKLAVDSLSDPSMGPGHIARLGALIVLAALVGGAAKFGMRRVLNGVSRRIECDLRNDLFQHLLTLDAGFFERSRTGDLMSRAGNDTLAVRMATGPAVMYAVNTAISFALSLALMLWISPRMTAVALIPLIALPPTVLVFGRVIHRRFEEIQEQFSSLTTMVQESLTGIRIVRAYGREDEQEREFEALNREYLSRNLALVRSTGFFHPLLMFMAGLGMVIVLWYGGGEIVRGRLTVGSFVAFNFYLALLIWPMIALGWVVNLFQRGAASMGRLNRIFATAPSVAPPADTRSLGEVRGEVEFRNVSFRYPGAKQPALRGISFLARPGETVALVGPTGAGKSTLVSLLARLRDPTEGEVLLDGVPLRRLDPAELRRHLGVVPQEAFLFSGSIRENIAMGLAEDRARRGQGSTTAAEAATATATAAAPEGGTAMDAGAAAGAVGVREAGAVGVREAGAARDATRGNGGRMAVEASRGDGNPIAVEAAQATDGHPAGGAAQDAEDQAIFEAARVAQLHETVCTFQDGYRTLLGERGINLSGGQKQRVALARALVRDPAVLILDDALSAVDTQTEARILTLLRDTLKDRTAFVVSHRVSAVRDADQILVLDRGTIVERGTHDELLAQGGAYAELLHRQLLEDELAGSGAPAGSAGVSPSRSGPE